MTNIHTLDLHVNNKITNEGIKNLTNIHMLDLGFNRIITDDRNKKSD